MVHILNGRACVTDFDGTKNHFGPGDTVIMPKDWTGRWDVLEDVHTIYVKKSHQDLPRSANSTSAIVVPYRTFSSHLMEDTIDPREGAPSMASRTVFENGHMSAGGWTCSPGAFSVTDLKKVFMEIMNCYMDTITPMMNKMYFTENYQEDDKDKENIYFKRLNAYKKFIRNDATINSILSIFKSIVKVEDTLFDLSPEYDNYISFKNGIYNLDTGHFRRRNVSDRFTKSLDWDYTPEVHSEIYNDIHTFFKKIQPDAEQRRFTVSFLKYCLWGGNPQAKFKMNIGYTAANGKTTEMEIHERAFPLYTDKLDRTIFNQTCTKRHKYCNKLVTLPIRLAYINELDDSKLDEDFLKDFADGKNIELEKMYGTMCENSRMQCKLITTSNKDPNLLPDGGVIRRATIQKYESRFVSASDVNEKKHIYLMDPTWVETRFSQDSYKQMYFLYLLAEGHIRPLNVPEANARLVAQTLNENDDFLPKLETHFVVTKDPKDKVSYLDIQKCFENMPVRALNGHLKRLGIEYDKNGSTNSTRKVYRGIRKYSMSEMQEMNSDHSELLIDDDDPE